MVVRGGWECPRVPCFIYLTEKMTRIGPKPLKNHVKVQQAEMPSEFFLSPAKSLLLEGYFSLSYSLLIKKAQLRGR